jgi:hypothetical protein
MRIGSRHCFCRTQAHTRSRSRRQLAPDSQVRKTGEHVDNNGGESGKTGVRKQGRNGRGRRRRTYPWPALSESLAQEVTSLNAASLDAKIVEMFETFSDV